MIIIKVLTIVVSMIWFLWTLWGLGIHFNWIEGEQPYETPFPTFRVVILFVLICLSVIL